jgi:hypothetical protein
MWMEAIGLLCSTGIKINIRDAPDTVFAGYPANPKAGYPAGYLA